MDAKSSALKSIMNSAKDDQPLLERLKKKKPEKPEEKEEAPALTISIGMMPISDRLKKLRKDDKDS